MKLKVALLEDNRAILKALKKELEETGLVEVCLWASDSDEFFLKLETNRPEALMLDIDLAGDSMTGLDVAQKVKLPVMFLSGKTRDFFIDIENMNMSMDYPVEHLTKPISQEKLKKLVPKFIDEIRAYNQKQVVYLSFKESRRNKINLDSIVYLCSDKEFGAESNNKRIFFNDRKPELLINFTFKSMESAGFNPKQFVTIHKSYVVNAKSILRYIDETHQIEVIAVDENGKSRKETLLVSENYRKYLVGKK